MLRKEGQAPSPLPKDPLGEDVRHDCAPRGGALRRAPGTAGPTARQGAAARPPPDAPGGFPRSAPRSPADRSGRFQPPPAPRLTARASGETDGGRAHLVGGQREGRGCGED